MRTLGIKELDRLGRRGCEFPGCGCAKDPTRERFYLHSRCHPEAPTWAWYLAGVLTIECCACRRVVARIQPAVEGRTGRRRAGP